MAENSKEGENLSTPCQEAEPLLKYYEILVNQRRFIAQGRDSIYAVMATITVAFVAFFKTYLSTSVPGFAFYTMAALVIAFSILSIFAFGYRDELLHRHMLNVEKRLREKCKKFPFEQEAVFAKADSRYPSPALARATWLVLVYLGLYMFFGYRAVAEAGSFCIGVLLLLLFLTTLALVPYVYCRYFMIPAENPISHDPLITMEDDIARSESKPLGKARPLYVPMADVQERWCSRIQDWILTLLSRRGR